MLNITATPTRGALALRQFTIDHLDEADGEGWRTDRLVDEDGRVSCGDPPEWPANRDWWYYTLRQALHGLRANA